MKITKPGGGWTGRRIRMTRGSSMRIIEMLGRLAVDARTRRGQPCERHDCPLRTKSAVPLWKRSAHEQLEILRQARAGYLRAIKRHHPDAGGKTEDMAELNYIWARVVRIFALRGIRLND